MCIYVVPHDQWMCIYVVPHDQWMCIYVVPHDQWMCIYDWLVVARQAGVYPSLHMFLVNKRFFNELLIPCSVQHALRILRGLVAYSSQSLGCLPAFVCGLRCSCFQFSVLWLSVCIITIGQWSCIWVKTIPQINSE
jgi:hypothetical protein